MTSETRFEDLLRSLASQEGHGLYPVGSHVQLDQWIDLAKGFLRQPQVSRTVLDQKNLERHRLSLRWASRFPLDSPGLPGTHSLPNSRQVCCVGNLTVASQKSLKISVSVHFAATVSLMPTRRSSMFFQLNWSAKSILS